MKAWGLNRTAPGVWQVSPSINVLNVPEPRVERGLVCATCPGATQTDLASKACALCGGAYVPSLWHETPAIVGVPDGEPWIR